MNWNLNESGNWATEEITATESPGEDAVSFILKITSVKLIEDILPQLPCIFLINCTGFRKLFFVTYTGKNIAVLQ